jgi:hypothetical protein
MGPEWYELARDRLSWVQAGNVDALLRQILDDAALKHIGSSADLAAFANALERRYPEYGVVAALLILHAGRGSRAAPAPRVEPTPPEDADVFQPLFDDEPRRAEVPSSPAPVRSGARVARRRRADSCGVAG